jgi:hypothetical protein
MIASWQAPSASQGRPSASMAAFQPPGFPIRFSNSRASHQAIILCHRVLPPASPMEAPAEYPVRRGISLPSLTPRNAGSPASAGGNEWIVIASEATQSILPFAARWIASRSLSSGAHSRDPLARNDAAPIFTYISAIPRRETPEFQLESFAPLEGAALP